MAHEANAGLDEVAVGMANRCRHLASEHHVQLREAEDEASRLSMSTRSKGGAQRLGKNRRQLEAAEAGAEHDDTCSHGQTISATPINWKPGTEATGPRFAAFDIKAEVSGYCRQRADRAPPTRGKGTIPPVPSETCALHLLSACISGSQALMKGGRHDHIESLPARPSLESLRKQAKKLARGIAAGDAGAIARARAQLPKAKLPLSQRDAQLVLAREYGFPGWQDLTEEVKQRLGRGLEWAVSASPPHHP